MQTMRRNGIKRLAVACAGSAALTLALAGGALADQPVEYKGTNSQGNLNGVNNSQVRHNGTVVREQAQAGLRAALVHKDLDASR